MKIKLLKQMIMENLPVSSFHSSKASKSPGIADPNYRPFTAKKLKGSFAGHLQTELDTKFKRYDFVDTPKGVKFISKSVTIDIPFNSDKTSIFDIVKKIENGK